MLLSLCLSSSGQVQPEYTLEKVGDFDEISNRQITSIVQDDDGFLWMGTWFGLLKYDGYEVSSYKPDVFDQGAVPARKINALLLAGDTIWIGSSDYGLCYFDRVKETFHGIPEESTGGFGGKQVTALSSDRHGNIWTGTRHGLYRINGGKPDNISLIGIGQDPELNNEIYISTLSFDTDNNLWIGTDRGIFFIHHYHLNLSSGTKALPVNIADQLTTNPDELIACLAIVPDQNQFKLWAGTRRGLSHYIIDRSSISEASHDGITATYIPHEEVSLVFEDLAVARLFYDSTKQNLWIGTNEKLYQMDPFTLSLSGDLKDDFNQNQRFSSIYKGPQNTIWIGTLAGLYRIGCKERLFETLDAENPDLGPLNINAIINLDSSFLSGTLNNGIFQTSLRKDGTIGETHPITITKQSRSRFLKEIDCGIRDQKGTIWLGTKGWGLISFKYQNNKISEWTHYGSNEPVNSIPDDNISSLAEHPDGSILVGTSRNGIMKIDPSNGNIQRIDKFSFSQENQTDYQVTDIIVESEEVIWAGTRGDGFFKITLSGSDTFEVTAFRNIKNDLGSLCDNYINDIFIDHFGGLWIGTEGGLSLFNRRTQSFRNFYEANGLSDNCIQGVTEDAQGMLWASTIHGLNKIDARILLDTSSNNAVRVFLKEDGLPSNYYHDGSAFKLSNDFLLMGSLKGAAYFKPSALKYKSNNSNPVIKALFLQGKRVKTGEKVNGRVLIKESLDRLERLELRAAEKNISITFSAPGFDFPSRTSYAYRLKGYNDQWTNIESENLKVSYLNFPSGEYTFEVRSSNPDGSWNPNLATLQIRHALPFWKSFPAIMIYLVLLTAVFLLFRKMTMQRSEWLNKLKLESYKREKNEELHQHKLRFFTNISHEIKTPLSLIIGPVKYALKSEKASDREYALTMVHRNTNRLLNLVNQLLEFRKAETENLSLGVSRGDISALTQTIVEDFRYYANERKITMSLDLEDAYIEGCIDRDKYEKVLFNLLSNAIKYTNPEGRIEIKVGTEAGENGQKKMLVCKVEDSGTGIPKDKLAFVFERYYRAGQDDTGIGIGLALSKKLVELHKGEITVESELGSGTVFQFKLPMEQGFYQADEFAKKASREPSEPSFISGTLMDTHKGNKEIPVNGEKILIVEDDPELRQFMKLIFQSEYHVLLAEDGEEGYQQAIIEKPDLVIADFLMPRMNGLELFTKLKKNHATENLSFILLTAHLDEKVEKEISRAGADLILNKPFDPDLLKIQVKNLLGKHKKMESHLKNELQIQKYGDAEKDSSKPGISDKIMAIIDMHCSDDNFNIDFLAQEMGMSRMKLYRTIKSLFKMSPVELIRKIKMVKVASSLKEKDARISEVAFQYGFSDMKHFRECFKKEFGQTPSEYIKINR